MMNAVARTTSRSFARSLARNASRSVAPSFTRAAAAYSTGRPSFAGMDDLKTGTGTCRLFVRSM